jgi:hypothetical protein
MGTTIGAAGPARADTMPAIVPTIERPTDLEISSKLTTQRPLKLNRRLQDSIWIRGLVTSQASNRVIHQRPEFCGSQMLNESILRGSSTEHVKPTEITYLIWIIEIPDCDYVDVKHLQTSLQALPQEIGARCKTCPVF